MAITATFEANFDQFVTAVKGATASLEGIKTSATQVGAAITASLASAEIRRFTSDVQQAAGEFIAAYAEEEAAIKSLETALQAQGTNTEAVRQQYADLAEQFQQTTKFSDDAMTKMAALMVQVGGVMPEQMQAALTAAANLASGLGIGLEQATMMVARAFGQGGESLGKLKTLLGDTVPKGADMAAVLAAINEKFGGQAAAEMETYTGQVAALGNQMNDFQEQVGQVLVQGLTPLLNAFRELPEGMQTAIVAVVAIGTALAPVALSFAAMTTVLTPLIPLIGTALAGAFTALVPFLGPAGLIAVGAIAVYTAFKNWDAITGFVRGVYDGVATWLGTKLTAIFDGIRDRLNAVTGYFRDMYNAVVGQSYVRDMVDGIDQQIGRLSEVMVEPVRAATAETTAAFSGMAASVGQSMQSITAAVGGMGGGGGTDGYRQLSASGSGKGLQLGVPADFGWAAAYRKAGYFVHDSPFIRKDIFDSPGAFAPRSSGSVNVLVNASGAMFDTPDGQQIFFQKVGDAVKSQLSGQGRSMGSAA